VYGWRVSASVRGKVALITGGARGVGAATATLLVARGAKVVLVDLDDDPLRELVQRLGEDSATSILGDVTVLAEMEAAVAHGVERFGAIDIVVANAGIASYGSVAVVAPNGPGSRSSISRNAPRSCLASCTIGVSIHDMCALPTATPR
jgi:NAD(P)-dependent dehydrogenase (short-subunit alcohol dehydrogenase family)